MKAYLTDLPKCDSSETKKSTIDLINKQLKAYNKENNENIKFIDIKNIKEIGHNKEKDIRVCSADVLYSDGDETTVTYNIYWENNKKDYFYVEFVD